MKLLTIFILLSFLVSFFGCTCNCTKEFERELSRNEAMYLTPKVKYPDDGTVVFILEAERVKKVEDEYMPSSEDFRVEIMSDKAKVLWSSNYNKNYMMVVGDVLPKEVGETHFYEMKFTGEKNSGNELQPGKYTAFLVIPSKPNHYVRQIEFTWGEKDD